MIWSRKRVFNLASDNLHWVSRVSYGTLKWICSFLTILLKNSSVVHFPFVWLADKQVNQVIDWRAHLETSWTTYSLLVDFEVFSLSEVSGCEFFFTCPDDDFFFRGCQWLPVLSSLCFCSNWVDVMLGLHLKEQLPRVFSRLKRWERLSNRDIIIPKLFVTCLDWHGLQK